MCTTHEGHERLAVRVEVEQVVVRLGPNPRFWARSCTAAAAAAAIVKVNGDKWIAHFTTAPAQHPYPREEVQDRENHRSLALDRRQDAA